MLTMFLGFVEFFTTISLAYIPGQFIPNWVYMAFIDHQQMRADMTEKLTAKVTEYRERSLQR